MTVILSLFSLVSRGEESVVHSETRAKALFLARELLEEVIAKAFEEPGTSGTFGRDSGESATNRTKYDDIDDYDDYGPNGPPRDVDASKLVDFSAFTRTVTVENVANANFGLVAADGSTSFKRVIVRVEATWPSEADVRLEAVVGRK